MSFFERIFHKDNIFLPVRLLSASGIASRGEALRGHCGGPFCASFCGQRKTQRRDASPVGDIPSLFVVWPVSGTRFRFPSQALFPVPDSGSRFRFPIQVPSQAPP